MADLTLANSTYSTGTSDTASTLVNNVSSVDAQQYNGVATACVGIQTVLGTGTTLKGNKADLVARLAVQMDADGLSNPVGEIKMYGGSAAPTNHLLCDGTAYSRTTYATLYGVIGTAYGAGDGSTTFNVPDFRSRGPIGVGTGTGGGSSGTGLPTGGSALNTIARGSWAGTEDAINVSHTHTVTDPGHTHTIVTGASSAVNGRVRLDNGTGGSATTNSNTTGISIDSSGSSGTDKNLPPYMGVNFIIRYQ